MEEEILCEDCEQEVVEFEGQRCGFCADERRVATGVEPRDYSFDW